jgi:hypothetical protein
LNEGHAAFAVLERARSFMHATGQSFEVALAVTRAGNLFTAAAARIRDDHARYRGQLGADRFDVADDFRARVLRG